MRRRVPLSLALLSAACATAPPPPLTLAVEATLACVVGVVEEAGFREERQWRGAGRSSVHVRFRRAGDELTVTLDDEGQGLVSVGYSYPSERRRVMEPQVSLLRVVVRSRCLP